MISQKQLHANSRNAQKSTGPKTPEGKTASRRNALVHGVTAEHLLLEGEDAEVFTALNQRLIDEFAPEGTFEAELVDQMANLMWRARRIPRFETALMKWMQAWCEVFADRIDRNSFGNTWGDEEGKLHRPLNRNPKNKLCEARAELALGRLLQHSLDRDFMAKLNRYEAHLLRQLKQAHSELKDLQRVRVQDGETAGALLNLAPAGVGGG